MTVPESPAIGDVRRDDPGGRRWLDNALRLIAADENRSADTHLLRFPLPASWGISFFLKDESTHPTGSLKHRLARSLILYGLVNGWIREGTTLVEASSGSTAVSEAYFARILGLPFVAVMTRSTSPEKIDLIEGQGGRCHFVDDPSHIYGEATEVARDLNGHYLDQFTFAERATDWRGNNNIAESIFEQLAHEESPVPHWIVVGAGTGGTSATIGRYVRYKQFATKVAVADPEGSAFFPAFRDGLTDAAGTGSRIEGIGRPRVEPSFLPSVIDRMFAIPDAASLAAMHCGSALLNRPVGGSTGTNLFAAFLLIAEMVERGERGSVVSLICDGGERYEDTYYDEEWLDAQGIDSSAYAAVLDRFLGTGQGTEFRELAYAASTHPAPDFNERESS